jgi:carotenoid cleavage dioxygenase-like enzyme
LLFSATHGATKQSFLVVVNAATMVEIERVPLPQTITFSTHGEFFKSL